MLFNEKFILYAPELLTEEITKHKTGICEKAGISEDEFYLTLSIIVARINIIPFLEFEQNISQAREICPDPDDVEYIALALARSCALWSNDKRLKEQTKVKVYSTPELTALFSHSSNSDSSNGK